MRFGLRQLQDPSRWVIVLVMKQKGKGIAHPLKLLRERAEADAEKQLFVRSGELPLG